MIRRLVGEIVSATLIAHRARMNGMLAPIDRPTTEWLAVYNPRFGR